MPKVFCSISLVRLDMLKPHEQISPARGKRIRQMLAAAGRFTRPIVADGRTRVILDGHHRCQALAKMGCRKVPALLVNYSSRGIAVRPRRKNVRVSKRLVLERARAKRLYPHKSTRHILPSKVPKINISFEKLR